LLQRSQAPHLSLKPYFDQLEEAGVVANKFAFYTLRSWSSLRNGTTAAAIANDPLNKGYFILGGGEEQHDLYTGAFSTVTVLHDVYYNTNLKSVRVDGSAAHTAAALQQQYYQDMISNSIVDSGTSDLTLAQDVYQAILQGLQQKNPAFAQAIKAGSDLRQGGVPTSSLNLAQWPNIYSRWRARTVRMSSSLARRRPTGRPISPRLAGRSFRSAVRSTPRTSRSSACRC
jgi:Eukaryotic aspartyl protease